MWAQGGPRPFPGASGSCAHPHLAGTWLLWGLRRTVMWGNEPGSCWRASREHCRCPGGAAATLLVCVAPGRWAARWGLSSDTAWPGPAHASCVTGELRWQGVGWPFPKRPRLTPGRPPGPRGCRSTLLPSLQRAHGSPEPVRLPFTSALTRRRLQSEPSEASSSRPPFTRPLGTDHRCFQGAQGRAGGAGSRSCEGLAGPSQDEQNRDSRKGGVCGVRCAGIQDTVVVWCSVLVAGSPF